MLISLICVCICKFPPALPYSYFYPSQPLPLPESPPTRVFRSPILHVWLSVCIVYSALLKSKKKKKKISYQFCANASMIAGCRPHNFFSFYPLPRPLITFHYHRHLSIFVSGWNTGFQPNFKRWLLGCKSRVLAPSGRWIEYTQPSFPFLAEYCNVCLRTFEWVW